MKALFRTRPTGAPRAHSSTRRKLAAAALLAMSLGLGAALPTPAKAQSGKAVKLLVGFPAGGGTDVIARTLADKLKDELGVPVVVENKPGAGGQIAAQALKAAAPDGSTFFLSHDHTITILPLVVKNPGFEPDRDFAVVAGFATFVNALALSGGTPAHSLPEYAHWMHSKNAAKGAVGVPAPASVPEFLVKIVGEKYKLDLVAAPYRGSSPMIADMLGSQIAAGIGSVPDFIENHKAGKLRVVAVMGGQRQALLPDVPTLSELGIKGFEDVPYYGVFAPAGTPKEVQDRFAQALAKVIALPAVKDQLTHMGLTVGFMSGPQLTQREKAYRQTWSRIISASGFVPQ